MLSFSLLAGADSQMKPPFPYNSSSQNSKASLYSFTFFFPPPSLFLHIHSSLICPILVCFYRYDIRKQQLSGSSSGFTQPLVVGTPPMSEKSLKMPKNKGVYCCSLNLCVIVCVFFSSFSRRAVCSKSVFMV